METSLGPGPHCARVVERSEREEETRTGPRVTLRSTDYRRAFPPTQFGSQIHFPLLPFPFLFKEKKEKRGKECDPETELEGATKSSLVYNRKKDHRKDTSTRL